VSKQSIFTADVATDQGYINTRAASNDRAKACRANCQALWEIFEPYADQEFRTEFRSAFDARYWEMYLAVALMDLGFEVTCPKPGPDVGINFDGRRIWFEATSPDRGKDGTPDQVPLPIMGVGGMVPNEQMILRYLNSISSKKAQHDNWLAKGIVSKDDAFIVALNPRGLCHDILDTVPPRILQAAFAVGNQYVTFDRETLKQVGEGFHFRDEIKKASGAPVSTGVFQQAEYNCLSGLLCSRVDVANQPAKLGEDFQLLPNPNADVPLPDKFRLLGKYFKVDRKGDEYSVTVV
jgi:hypothetical protein